ncbi:MAG: ABC transporter ATP-binding protein [Chloroflexaceae bacterium]|nr:ABC transporter ATP-binding protein [Chloroflexaceae bacterium]
MPEPILTTSHLSIGYTLQRKPARVVAAGLDLALQAGELVALLGPNGAGKSTLIRTIAAMQPPLDGQVWLDGQPVARFAPHELARRLAVVLTERVDVGNLSAYGLVALGRHPYTDWLGTLTPHDERIVQQALLDVGAAELAERTLHELSDGERQRVMIARALAQEPLLLILDEPTAFLDLPRRVEMMRLLRQLAHRTGRAILLSTHDLDLALRSADLLWLMETGGKLHTGAPEDLVLNGAFEATFRREGVTFDTAHGTFQINPPPTRRVRLLGEGVVAIWTARALERAGCTVIGADVPTALSIQVQQRDGRPLWVATQDGMLHEYTSVYELVRAIRAGR